MCKVPSALMLLFAVVLWPFHSARSEYSANHSSTVKWVKIYNSDIVYFALHTMPTTACSEPYFVLNTSLTQEQRERYYAMLLTAKVTGDPVSVGYGTQAVDCYADKPIVYALALSE